MNNPHENISQEKMNNEEKMEQQAANGLSLSEIREVVANQMHGYSSAGGMSVTKLVRMLGGAITGRKSEYELAFVKDEGTWYVDLPNWPWKRENLAMVCGADKMLDLLSDHTNNVKLRVKPTDNPAKEEERKQLMQDDWIELTQTKSSLTGGATYTAKGYVESDFVINDYLTGQPKPRTLWLCPVTLFVLGHYPNNIYAKVIKETTNS